MKVTNEMVNDFCLAIVESEDEPSGLVGDSVRNDVRKGLQSVFNAIPNQEPVCYVDQPSERLIDWNTELFHFSFELPEAGTPLYANPQPPREPLSESEIKHLLNEREDGLSTIDLVRAVEKAHGIGV